MSELNSDNLIKKANKFGITPQDESFVEFEKRVLSAIKNKRESKLFIIALISAAASVISAMAAWFAVLK